MDHSEGAGGGRELGGTAGPLCVSERLEERPPGLQGPPGRGQLGPARVEAVGLGTRGKEALH